MIKKNLLATVILYAALAVTMASNALAAFGNLELVRVVLQQTGGTTEIATDLGTVSSVLAGGTFGGGSDAFTAQAGGTDFAAGSAGLHAVYFAVNQTTKELWITGVDPSISAGKSTTITGLTTNIFSYYNINLGGGPTVLANASAQNSYRVKADATTQFGQFGSAIVLAARPFTEANLAALATSGSVTQTLYHFSNYAVASAGVAVATITTNADGSTTIDAVTAVNGVCGSADGVPVATIPTAGLCTSGTESSITGSGPWNWTCNGQNGGTQAACSAPVLQTSTTPTITWATPAAITYGTALSATQLNATASDPVTSADVPGTFAYTPALGSVPTAGTQSLSLTFTPTDAINYTMATATVDLTVNQATPTITWASPAAITYGTTLSSTQLNATASVPGTFAYTPALGSLLNAGTQSLSLTFTPTDAINYTTATATVNLTVNQATPTITWASPAAITYGTALSATQLNATASVPGTFAYTPALGSLLNAGTQSLSLTFTPTDAINYTTATATVNLTVNQATPTITWASPAAITYGTALSATQLNATASVPGTFAYSPTPGSLLNAGTQSLSVIFTPSDTVNYSTAAAAVKLAVIKATPTITWAAPAAITYGTALSATQLNATASVPGTFTYSPALGSILSNGNQILTVTFTPSDIANNTTANTSVGLTVDPTVRVMGDKGYDSLLAVTQAISKDSTIQARDIYTTALPETLIFNNGFNVTLNGGYNSGFAEVTGVTVIQGKLTIKSGKLIVSGVAIKP